jgi:hypothetical protein
VSCPKNGSHTCLSLLADGDWSESIASSFTCLRRATRYGPISRVGTMVAPKRLRVASIQRSALARDIGLYGTTSGAPRCREHSSSSHSQLQ